MDPSKPIRVLSVEDHPIFREGLSTIIASQADMTLVSQATDGRTAIAMFRQHRPDLTLMDLRLPRMDGVATLLEIRKEFPEARIIMLTTSESDGDIQRAMRAGAAAYILKSMPKEEILSVMRSVHQRRRFMPTQVAALIAEHLGEEQLTARELDVLRLIRDGHRNKQIADDFASRRQRSISTSRISWTSCKRTTVPMRSRLRFAGGCLSSKESWTVEICSRDAVAL